MTSNECADRWEASFSFARSMADGDRRLARASLVFSDLEQGAVAYEFDAPCRGYLMCMGGGTRVLRPTAAKLDVMLYRVTNGGACALTTQCLVAGGRLAARSVAETDTKLAVLPTRAFTDLMRSSTPFRDFVLKDYFNLASRLAALVKPH